MSDGFITLPSGQTPQGCKRVIDDRGFTNMVKDIGNGQFQLYSGINVFGFTTWCAGPGCDAQGKPL